MKRLSWILNGINLSLQEEAEGDVACMHMCTHTQGGSVTMKIETGER